jgi:two-component system sensor histidine kinase ChvG
VTVEDEGPGIPEDKLEKIFQRFYTDRPKGAKFGNNSGLGLSIVRQITETHRGAVWAENRMTDGKISGARFIVDLPAAALDI